jgi:hypothetical protein
MTAGHAGDHDSAGAARESEMHRCLKALPFLAALTLGLALAACDHCGDFDWRGHACHTHPAEN